MKASLIVKPQTLSPKTKNHWQNKKNPAGTIIEEEKTSWHRIVIFNDGLAGVVESYVKKGSKLYIEGQLQTRKFTDQNNNKKYTTEVSLGNYNGTLTMLDSRGSGSSESISDMSSDMNQEAIDSSPADIDIDDEIPF